MPTLMFCAGTVKSGTSWLHAYLRSHPEVYLRTIKETRFYTSLEGGWRRVRIQKLDEETAKLEAEAEARLLGPTPLQLRQIADRKELRKVLNDYSDPEGAYLRFLLNGVEGRRLVGEMTPEYGLLSAETYGQINALAPDVRWLLLMRDPVSRLWSHVRMLVRRSAPAPEAFAAACAAKFDEVLAGKAPDVVARGDYAAIHGRLVQAVAPGKRLDVIYEQLMSQVGVDRVTQFLGLSAHPAPVDKVVHGGIALDMPAPLRARAREWLRPQYEYVARVMGLPPEWESFPEYRSEVA